MDTQPQRGNKDVPDLTEFTEWVNTQAQTPIGSLIVFLLILAARLYLRDLLEKLDRPKKKKKKGPAHG